MAKFDPSIGAEESFERAEEAFAAEVAFYKEREVEILEMIRVLLMSPHLPSLVASRSPLAPKPETIAEFAAGLVRHGYIKGRDNL